MNDYQAARLALAAGQFAQPRYERSKRSVQRMQLKVASFMVGGCLAILLLALATVLW